MKKITSPMKAQDVLNIVREDIKAYSELTAMERINAEIEVFFTNHINKRMAERGLYESNIYEVIISGSTTEKNGIVEDRNSYKFRVEGKCPVTDRLQVVFETKKIYDRKIILITAIDKRN